METPTLTKHSRVPVTVPRVLPPKPYMPPYTPTSVLQQHSNKEKSTRFNNKTDHRYPLRSRARPTNYNLRQATHITGTNFKDLASRLLLAQNILQHKIAHIFRPNGTKETIDSMLNSPDKEI